MCNLMTRASHETVNKKGLSLSSERGQKSAKKLICDCHALKEGPFLAAWLNQHSKFYFLKLYILYTYISLGWITSNIPWTPLHSKHHLQKLIAYRQPCKGDSTVLQVTRFFFFFFKKRHFDQTCMLRTFWRVMITNTNGV